MEVTGFEHGRKHYRTINRCFMRFQDRAERIDTRQIAETFVSVGPLLDVLESRNNQIMYGRRGTGKTHASNTSPSTVRKQEI
jgi:Cdc6-like AAA superfamily ATPase